MGECQLEVLLAHHALRFHAEAPGKARLREALSPYVLANRLPELACHVDGLELAIHLDGLRKVPGCEALAGHGLEGRTEFIQPRTGQCGAGRRRMAAEADE